MGVIGGGAEEGAEHVDELCTLESDGLGEGAEDGDVLRTGRAAGSHADFPKDDERAQGAFGVVVGGGLPCSMKAESCGYSRGKGVREKRAVPNGTKLGLFSDVGRPSRLPSCLGKAGGTPAPLFTNLVPFGAVPRIDAIE